MSRTGYARVIVADGLLAPAVSSASSGFSDSVRTVSPARARARQKPPGRTLIGWMARSPTASMIALPAFFSASPRSTGSRRAVASSGRLCRPARSLGNGP
jgi:hypothetical protein